MKITPGAFRFFLASLVIFDHFSSFDIGSCAVDVFFVLSGYWIYIVYQKKYINTANPVLTFLTSRILRLLPVFLLFNVATMVTHFLFRSQVWNHTWHWRDFIANVGILFYAGQAFKAMVPAWSLDIELQFYLIVPFMLFLLMRAGKHRAWVLAITAAMVAADALANGLQHRSIGTSVVFYIGFFTTGLVAANIGWRPSARLYKAAGSLAAGLVLVLAGLPATRGILFHKISSDMFFWNTMVNSILAIILIPVAIFSVHNRSTKADRFLGDISYVVYCAHWVGVLVARQYFADLHGAIKAIAVGGDIAVIGLISVAALVCYDRPISAMRERWVASRRRTRNAMPFDKGAFMPRNHLANGNAILHSEGGS